MSIEFKTAPIPPPTPDILRTLDARDGETEETSNLAKVKLSIRNPFEILDLVWEQRNYWDNGYLVERELHAICGMGGVGKSRLVMQMALFAVTGRPLWGWPLSTGDQVWLFIQAENSIGRFKSEFAKMLPEFNPEEQELIRRRIRIHTLEEEHDGNIDLEDEESRDRVVAVIRECGAGIVVWDPLKDCTHGDLNTDVAMSAVLKKIARITRLGNPKASPIVLHHAGEGTAGVKKVSGFDRSSFGRNSKVLRSWTRTQINIAPANPDDCSTLIIASGKNNLVAEIKPFAVVLDETTMLYHRMEGFDFEEWRAALDAGTPAKAKVDENTIRAILNREPGLTKKDLAHRIMKAATVATSTAYDAIKRFAVILTTDDMGRYILK